MTTFCIVFYESYHSRQTVTKYDVANPVIIGCYGGPTDQAGELRWQDRSNWEEMRNLSGKYRTRHNSKARFRGSPSYRMPMDDEGQNGKCILKGLHLRVWQTKTPFLQWRKHSPNPDIPEGVLQIRTKRLKKVHIHAGKSNYRKKKILQLNWSDFKIYAYNWFIIVKTLSKELQWTFLAMNKAIYTQWSKICCPFYIVS